MSVEGAVGPEVFIRSASQSRIDQGRRFDPGRYFCGEGELVVFAGRTYAFSTQWGGSDWLAAMNGLRDAFPERQIAFTSE
ncbi:MAG: hypothetical protein ACK4U0_13965 [Mesorhizobium sp.]